MILKSKQTINTHTLTFTIIHPLKHTHSNSQSTHTHILSCLHCHKKQTTTQAALICISCFSMMLLSLGFHATKIFIFASIMSFYLSCLLTDVLDTILSFLIVCNCSSFLLLCFSLFPQKFTISLFIYPCIFLISPLSTMTLSFSDSL